MPSAPGCIEHLPNDRRVVLVVIGFCFGALLEGIAGFGTPVAITSSLLILVGFPAIEALVFVLIFNTAPVAFGALGVPVTVLGAVTGLPATDARRDGRPAVAVHGAAAAVLCDGAVRRLALGPRAVAGAAGRGRQLRGGAIRRLELHRLHADRRALLAWLADRHAAVPAGLASGAGSGISRSRKRRLRQRSNLNRRSLAGLAALAHRVGDRHRLDALWLAAIGQQNIPWPGCTMRSRSRSITTSPMPRSGPSSRSPPEPRSWWRPSSRQSSSDFRRGRFLDCVGQDLRGRSGWRSSP